MKRSFVGRGKAAGHAGFDHRALWLMGVVPLLASCATTSRLAPQNVPAGSLRLAQVMYLGTRAEITGDATTYRLLRASGIADSAIHDGSVALARVYCCRGPNERINSIAFYVPAGQGVELGDIVEVESGSRPGRGSEGTASVSVRVRQKHGESQGPCRWLPENDRLWSRILYCDWMPAEGWVLQHGLWNTWLKRAAPAK